MGTGENPGCALVGCTTTCANACGGCGTTCSGCTGCSGGCQGCTGCGYSCTPNGCTGQCGDACRGCTGCTGCSNECTGCTGCSGGCSGCSGCGGACSNNCSGSCKDGCQGTCQTSCALNCADGCSGKCGTACSNDCTACTGSCKATCDKGCSTTAMIDLYNKLGLNVKLRNIIYATDLYDIEKCIINELERRNEYPNNAAIIAPVAFTVILSNIINSILTKCEIKGYKYTHDSNLITSSELQSCIDFIKKLYEQDTKP